MGLTAGHFSSPPAGLPSGREIAALSARMAMGPREHRVALMNEIGAILGIPPGGWPHGQSRLFEHGDVRIVWLLRRSARMSTAERISANLARCVRFGGSDIFLTVVTAARENASSLTDISSRPIDSFEQGGLDFLWEQKSQLGLPPSITSQWGPARRRINPETGRLVEPALIPGHDQLLAYGAQIKSSFHRSFEHHLHSIVGAGATRLLSEASRPALLAWKTYAFLAPGGRAFDKTRGLDSQLTQAFGCHTCLGYLGRNGEFTLDALLTTPELNRSEWVRSSKTRAAETLFLERALTTTRELMSPGF